MGLRPTRVGALLALPACAARVVLGIWLAVEAAFFSPIQAQTVPGAEIIQFRIERNDNVWYLNVNLRLTLSTAVEEALNKGVPVYFVAESTLMRDRWYWMDRRVNQQVKSARLAYQPLTRRWRLTMSQGASSNGHASASLAQYFDQLPDALAVISRMASWKLAEGAEVDDGARHYVEFRFRLDTTQLPRALQLGTVNQSEWALNAEHTQRLN